jgi:hypothetical protein
MICVKNYKNIIHTKTSCPQKSLFNILQNIYKIIAAMPANVSRKHRVHRVATADFWRTCHHDGKISPGWWGWGCTLPYLPSHKKLQCTLQLRFRYTPPISPLPLCTLCQEVNFSLFTLSAKVLSTQKLIPDSNWGLQDERFFASVHTCTFFKSNFREQFGEWKSFPK